MSFGEGAGCGPAWGSPLLFQKRWVLPLPALLLLGGGLFGVQCFGLAGGSCIGDSRDKELAGTLLPEALARRWQQSPGSRRQSLVRSEGCCLSLPAWKTSLLPFPACLASQGTLQPGEEPVWGCALPGPNPSQAGQAVQPPRGEPARDRHLGSHLEPSQPWGSRGLMLSLFSLPS